MAVITTVIIIAIVIVIILSSLPLYLSVMLLGGRPSITKVFLTNIVVAIGSAVLIKYIGLGSLWVLLITILFYSFIFRMGIIRAFLAWLVQYVVAVILIIALIALGVLII
jgi:hypothetical protein